MPKTFGGKMQVITLCGSTKFKKQFREAEASLTLQGNIVISLGFFEQSEVIEITEEQEKLFEEIHYRKIDMSDEIFVIDVNGYIGNSTRKEIEYAKRKGYTLLLRNLKEEGVIDCFMNQKGMINDEKNS